MKTSRHAHFQIYYHCILYSSPVYASILSKEVDKLKKYVTSGDIEVSEISLEYMLFADKNETYDIKPVWVVYYYQNQLVTGENSYTQKMALYDVYDAYTGEEYRIQ